MTFLSFYGGYGMSKNDSPHVKLHAESTMRKTQAGATSSARMTELLDKIAAEQQKIDRQDGDVVACYVSMGQCLAELRPLAKRNWARQLKLLGIAPRVASRRMKLAQRWPDGIGHEESELLPRLPSDLLKLEWLCRLDHPQLSELLTHFDAKRATRPQVIAQVREALGEAPPAKPDLDVEQVVQHFIDRMLSTAERLSDKYIEPSQRDHARHLLVAGLCRIQEALTDEPVGMLLARTDTH